MNAREIHTVNMGKNGANDAFIADVKKRIHKHKEIKIRMLPSARGEDKCRKKEIALDVSKKVRAKLLDVRGNTFILSRKKGGK